MLRAAAIAEGAGVPSVSIVTTPFMQQAAVVMKGVGMPGLPIAEYPGVPMTDGPDTVRAKVEALIEPIVGGLARPVATTATAAVEPGPSDVLFSGTLDEVQDFFYRNLWTDGLPVIPPTIPRVERFLEFTKRSPGDVIGQLLPENRAATVWSIAVNGVMAGCRPEYMPLLVALVEAIAEPEFRVQDAGSTPGWEPLVIVSGPVARALDLNHGQGVMRVGRQANTSLGRFLRLYLRNVAGLRIPPGAGDKGSIASTFNVALAEDEAAAAGMGWTTFGQDQGFAREDSVVTVQSVVSASPPIYTAGTRALD
ncbi:MAG: UGSC family (seleno)protein, partial [candidate division NC10 bacterium]